MKPIELAERALEAAPPGDGALARVISERSLLMRFARSAPTQSTAVEDLSVEITVLRDGRLGTATTNGTEPGDLAGCAKAAETAAEAAARTGAPGGYPGFPGESAPRAHDGFDPDTARIDAEAGGAAMRAAFTAAERAGVEAHGVWSAGAVEHALVSSAGAHMTDRVTDAFMKSTAIAPDTGRSGYATGAGISTAAIDAEAVAERSSSKAAATGDPARLEPGVYPVVLEPDAMGELLMWLGWMAFDGLAYAEERSAVAGRLGQRVVAPGINLSDSPRFASTLPRAFDAEGTPKAPIPLIQDGVAHRVAHDVRSAARAGDGAVSTGHASAPGGTEWGIWPSNLVLIGGGAADSQELCAGIERGIYVTRLWYVNPVRPRETLVTGVTRDGTFLIEDGRITRPLEDMRLTDSVFDMLGRASGLGAEPVLVSDGEFYGRRFASGVVTPPVRVDAVRFSA
ncbi:MAG: TldD/PmbA family protein [Thermoleophilaceae bacterium]|nr:TldD/PmbA family protein [Thermoleophilaceae bacterium]